ncbi:MAG: dTDP-4-amino-4,6-dideoxygalactose transaminase [Oscillospiraceae bacterium]|nr:dTDP-4-amino-4,6-dideoxygalactose transaminase [Oscillospiraceae bacterium]
MAYSIPFNRPALTGRESQYIGEALAAGHLSGDGPFTKRCGGWLERQTGVHRALLTTSCTHALEMAALLLDIRPGDEVIMPSYTFVSTANAFVLRGGVPVFVDIRPDTMNIDENLIEAAITSKTRAIVPVHYAGVGCGMDKVNAIAAAYKLAVVEDAAQGLMAAYKNQPLGAIGELGCLSFHETKNYTMGEGGALLIRDPERAAMAEIIREKGTDRGRFLRGEVDKYTWQSAGSSYLPSELNAACLWGQLEAAAEILNDRLAIWDRYAAAFAGDERFETPKIPEHCQHNAHMYWIKCKDAEQREALRRHLAEGGIQAASHYVPLHTSPAGSRFGRFAGEDRYTTAESERILRLPLWYGLSAQEQMRVVETTLEFFKKI